MTLQAEIFENSTTTYTKSLYQYDRNVTLVFDGIELPEKYEVHFSNDKDGGISVACKGGKNGVKIPNELLSTGKYVYAWICALEGVTGDEALTNIQCMIVIPVIPKSIPVPVQIIEESKEPEKWEYEISADDENLTFINSPDGMLIPTTEPDD